MKMKLVDIKDPVLRKKAKKVQRFDKKLQKLVSDMLDTLEAQDDPEGVGLAAPQVGKSLQVFVISYKKHKEVIINPVILERKEKKSLKSKRQKILEGCLSLPHYYGPIKRAKEITISYQDQKGEKITKTFKGFLAQIVEHEIDHLKGVIFIDHVLSQKQPLYKIQGDVWEEVELS